MPNRRLEIWPVVLTIVVTVGACGGSAPSVTAQAPAPPSAALVGPSSSASTASSTPSASAPPTQDELRAAAALAYRKAVVPLNRTSRALWKKYGDTISLKARRTFCSKLDVATRTWIKALQAITWPTDTAADAKALIRAEASADANLRACAKATSSSSAHASWDRFLTFDDRSFEAANLVRLDIGLNPVPG
jgi:hypothetical protein